MLLFFIYAALGVELFGRLGECGGAVTHPPDTPGRRSFTHALRALVWPPARPLWTRRTQTHCADPRVFTPRPGRQSRTRMTARANTGVAPSLPAPRVVLQAALPQTSPAAARPVWVGACGDLSWQPRSYGSPLALGVSERNAQWVPGATSGPVWEGVEVAVTFEGLPRPRSWCPDPGPGDSQA